MVRQDCKNYVACNAMFTWLHPRFKFWLPCGPPSLKSRLCNWRSWLYCFTHYSIVQMKQRLIIFDNFWRKNVWKYLKCLELCKNECKFWWQNFSEGSPCFFHALSLFQTLEYVAFCSLQLHDQVYSSIQYVGLSSKSADTMATTTRLSNVRGAGPTVEGGLKNCKPNQNVWNW